MDRNKFNIIDKEDRIKKKVEKELLVADAVDETSDIPAFIVNENTCEYCGKKYKKPETLKLHYTGCPKKSLVVTREPVMYFCVFCDRYIKNRNVFVTHCKVSHNIVMTKTRLMSCIVKQTKSVPPHKVLVFNKRKSKPVSCLRKNVLIKKKEGLVVIDNSSEINCDTMGQNDCILDSFCPDYESQPTVKLK